MFIFNPDYPNANNAQKLEQIRKWRDLQLAASDWTQVADAPVNKSAWAEYRQALRDVPQQDVSAENIIFPVMP